MDRKRKADEERSMRVCIFSVLSIAFACSDNLEGIIQMMEFGVVFDSTIGNYMDRIYETSQNT